MRLSEISVENYPQVYRHFRDLKLNRRRIQRLFAFANLLLRPRVHYAKGARDDLDRIRDQDYHHIYVFNHRDSWDGYVIYAVLHQMAPYDVGNIRALANSVAFEAYRFRLFAPVSKAIGFVPVFLKTYYTQGRRHKHHPERLKLLPEAMEATFDCFTYIQAQHRQKVLVCPEGMYNKGAPATLLPVRRGVGEIAHRIAQLGQPVAITTIAFAYGTSNQLITRPRNTSVYVDRSVDITPDMSVDRITKLVRQHLQSSVEQAVKLY